MTCCAPTAIAACQSAACGSARLTRMTWPRRGSAGSAQRRAPPRRAGRPPAPVQACRLGRVRSVDDAAHPRRRRRGRRRRAAPVGDHREDAVGCVHQPTVRRATDMPPVPSCTASVDECADLWKPTDARYVWQRKRDSATTARVPHLSADATNTPEKGRPPPGGEEAEVVVYQPRGVGLMHTRHKPSNPHYTHGKRERRK